MKKSKNQEEKILMNRWVFDHAYAMIEEFNMGRSEAFRQAYLVRELLVALGQGEVVFEYVKQNGDERKARGTLCHGISEKYDAYKYKDKVNRDSYGKLDIAYWDLDKEGFRNFSIVNVKSIVEVTIKNNELHVRKATLSKREFHEL